MHKNIRHFRRNFYQNNAKIKLIYQAQPKIKKSRPKKREKRKFYAKNHVKS